MTVKQLLDVVGKLEEDAGDRQFLVRATATSDYYSIDRLTVEFDGENFDLVIEIDPTIN